MPRYLSQSLRDTSREHSHRYVKADILQRYSGEDSWREQTTSRLDSRRRDNGREANQLAERQMVLQRRPSAAALQKCTK